MSNKKLNLYFISWGSDEFGILTNEQVKATNVAEAIDKFKKRHSKEFARRGRDKLGFERRVHIYEIERQEQ
jgi:hypothetical protein